MLLQNSSTAYYREYFQFRAQQIQGDTLLKSVFKLASLAVFQKDRRVAYPQTALDLDCGLMLRALSLDSRVNLDILAIVLDEMKEECTLQDFEMLCLLAETASV